MMRWLVRAVVWLAPLAIVGCAGDPREAKIDSVLGYLNAASEQLATIKERVNDAIKKAENNKLNAKEMKEAQGAVDSLKTLSKDLQKVKQQIEGLASSTPKEQRDALAEQFRPKLSAAMARIDEERRALEKTILEAEALDKESVAELRSKLTEAEGNFVMLARQR